jgi:hypothetical protein
MVSQALMPKRCNVLLETVKELPPLQVLEKKGEGLCHDRSVKTQNPVGASLLAKVVNYNGTTLTPRVALRRIASKLAPTGIACSGVRHWYNGQPAV